MRRRKVRKMRMTRGEKILYIGATLAFCLTFVIKIFCGASIGNLKMSVEEMHYNITSQEKKNESLVMKVNSLTSFDKIQSIVKEMGLAYNYDNIVNVSGE